MFISGKVDVTVHQRVNLWLRPPTLPTSPRSLRVLPSVPTSTCPSPTLLNRCKNLVILKCSQLTDITTGFFFFFFERALLFLSSFLVTFTTQNTHVLGICRHKYADILTWKEAYFCTPWHLLMLVKHTTLLFVFQHGQKTHLNVSSLYVSSLIIDGNRRRHNPASLRSLRDDGWGEWGVRLDEPITCWVGGWQVDSHPFSCPSSAISLSMLFLFLKRNQVSFPVKTKVN